MYFSSALCVIFTSRLLGGQVVGDISARIVKLARKWQAGSLIPDLSSIV
jgi:hypothetical protein